MSYWTELANRAALWVSAAIMIGVALIVIHGFVTDPSAMLTAGG